MKGASDELYRPMPFLMRKTEIYDRVSEIPYGERTGRILRCKKRWQFQLFHIDLEPDFRKLAGGTGAAECLRTESCALCADSTTCRYIIWSRAEG